MKLLEAIGWKDYPIGGAELPQNFKYAFEAAVLKQIKEVELTETEMRSFLRTYSSQVSADIQLAKGDFYFWGVHIIKIKE